MPGVSVCLVVFVLFCVLFCVCWFVWLRMSGWINVSAVVVELALFDVMAGLNLGQGSLVLRALDSQPHALALNPNCPRST